LKTPNNITEETLHNIWLAQQRFGLWKTFFENLKESEVTTQVQLFRRLAAIQSLQHVNASGLEVEITNLDLEYLWFYLLPLCLWMKHLWNMFKRRILIGIVGGPGAGKSVFSQIISKSLNLLFGEVSEVVGMDAYHFPNSYLETHYLDDNKSVPLSLLKGDPVSFDIDSFNDDLTKVKNIFEESILLPIYDRKVHDPVLDQLKIEPSHFCVLVEGMLLLHDVPKFSETAKILDFVLYLDVEMEECHQRVVARKVNGGRNPKDAESHFQRVDKPNIERVAQSIQRADIIIKMKNGIIADVQTVSNRTHKANVSIQ